MATAAWGGLQGRANFINKEMADDEVIALTGGRPMLGFALICDSAGANTEYAVWYADKDAVVSLIHNSANVSAADVDGDFCVYDGGTKVYIKNRLNGTFYVTAFLLYASNGSVPFGFGAT